MKIVKRIAIDSLGWLVIVAGILAVFVPIVPGFVLIAVGLYLLSLHSAWFRERVNRHKHRYPRVVAMLERLDTRIRRLLHIL